MSANGVAYRDLQGVVEARNDHGVKVAGEWTTVSRFHAVELPDVGAHVRLRIDAKGYIRDLDVLEPTTSMPSPRASRDETITRLSVLKTAAVFAATRSDIKSADVLTIADRWLAWVNEA
jgi:hypothetical protein